MAPHDAPLVAWAMAQPAAEWTVPAHEELVRSPWREKLYLLAKRTVDVVFGFALIVLTLPLMLAAALVVKLTSPGPIMFRQLRAGYLGRPFWMYKFRSMYHGAEDERVNLDQLNEMDGGPCFKLREDPRLTPIGRFLRRTSIDELPQLFSVVKGEMTLVGPRPLPLTEVLTNTPAERRRLEAQPGITCLWQISGRCEIPYREWMLLDQFYVENRSLMLDFEILLKTIPAVLSRRGAY